MASKDEPSGTVGKCGRLEERGGGTACPRAEDCNHHSRSGWRKLSKCPPVHGRPTERRSEPSEVTTGGAKPARRLKPESALRTVSQSRHGKTEGGWRAGASERKYI